MQVQAFVAHSPVEAFLLPVLPGLARLDLQGLNTAVCQPDLDRHRHEFGAIVAAQVCQCAVLRKECRQFIGLTTLARRRFNH
jgi:hypothetical protein